MKRIAFGATLDTQVLHVQTFAREEVSLLAGFLLTMELVHLLGREECGLGNADETAILRLMTPVCKLFTARAAVASASEVVEGFGGAGYVEDVGIARHLRDAQVFPIWEGATNVLSLDMLRVLQNVSAFAAWASDVEARIGRVSAPDLLAHATQVQSALASLTEGVASMLMASDEEQAASSRELAFALAWTYASALALSWAHRETPLNKASLQPWLSSLIANTGAWCPRDAASIERSRAIWTTNLAG